MPEYNIYAGLSGGFGGAEFQTTAEFENEDEATAYAWELACEEYDSRAGNWGLRSLEEVRVDEGLEEEEENDEVDNIYNEERENWLSYYAVLASEDPDHAGMY